MAVDESLEAMATMDMQSFFSQCGPFMQGGTAPRDSAIVNGTIAWFQYAYGESSFDGSKWHFVIYPDGKR